jgi:hypothetical protein
MDAACGKVLHQRIYLESRGGCKGFEGTSKYVGALLLLVIVLDLPGICQAAGWIASTPHLMDDVDHPLCL